MTPLHPFRFIAPLPPLGASAARWRDELRRIEELGYDSISVSEHLVRGWALDAMVTLLAVADATVRLRVLSLVLAGDLRHPVLLHKGAATVDVLSGGRLELGLGAGWLAADTRAMGHEPPTPVARLERFEETLEIIDALFTSEVPVTYRGRHLRVEDVLGEPRPVQQPRPPLLVGGGGRRILALAARHADIVGIHARLPAAGIDAIPIEEFGVAALEAKVRHVAASAAAAGRDPAALELQFTAYAVDLEGEAPGGSGRLANRVRSNLGGPSPAHLKGSIDDCVEQLQRWREELGFSYWKLAGDPGLNAPIVARLSGR